jgi:Predicted nucleic acid-binding protein, contains PIN domain
LSRFVLDCSVTAAWCIEDEANPSTDRLLDSLQSGEAFVPALWPLEISNVLLTAERRRLLTRAQAFQCLEMLRSLPIVVDESTSSRAMGEILSLARDQNLSVYDAAYLELSIREALPLATRDRILAGAAKRCGVPLK